MFNFVLFRAAPNRQYASQHKNSCYKPSTNLPRSSPYLTQPNNMTPVNA